MSAALVSRLGYLPGDKVYVEGAPRSFTGELEYAGVHPTDTLPADWVHIFVAQEAALHTLLVHVELEKVAKGLWVSWPKLASGIETNITQQTLRDAALPLGWIDTKVCEVDDIWSALRFTRQQHSL